MQAALTAKEAGHDVELYEGSDHLGGHLTEAGSHPFKQGIYKLNHWYQKQLEKEKIPVHLNTMLTAEDIKVMHPDVAILATGSDHFIPASIPGGRDHEKSVVCYDVLMHKKQLGKKVVIVGGGLTGSELAYDLASFENKDVTLVEALPDILAAGAQKAVSMMLRDLLDYHHVNIMTGHKIVSVTDAGALVENVLTGEQILLEADNVVFAIGLKPKASMVKDLMGSGIEVHEIGDGKQVSNIRQCTSEAYEIARKL